MPFVSLQAAALAVGRVIAAVTGVSRMPNLVHYDGLFSPQAATIDDIAILPRLLLPDKVRRHRQGARAAEGDP